MSLSCLGPMFACLPFSSYNRAKKAGGGGYLKCKLSVARDCQSRDHSYAEGRGRKKLNKS